jgi:archaetidylinositol phosphate synthase
MALSRTKGKFESVLTPVAVRVPLSPNVLTLLAVLVMAVAAVEVVQSNFMLAAALVILSGFIDVLDGTVAKAKNKTTAFGAFADRVGDRISDALIFGSIVLAGFVQLWLGLVVLVLVLLGSYTSACLEAFSKTRIGEAFSMRAVRLLLVVVGLLLASYTGLLSYMEYIFAIIAVLAIAALVQRLWVSYKLIK